MNRPGVFHAPLELNHPRSEPGFTLTASRRPFSSPPPGGVPRSGLALVPRSALRREAGGRARCVRAVRAVPRGATGQRPVGALNPGRLPRAAAGGAPAAARGTTPFPQRPQDCGGVEPRPLGAGQLGLRSLASLTRSPVERLLVSGVCVSFPVTDRGLFF